MKRQVNVKRLTRVAILLAIEIVLSRFCSISTPIAKIGFAFLPLSIIAMLYGPLYAGFAGAAADFIGAMLFPIGAFFPGFTLTALLTGVTYGLLLHEHEKSTSRIVASTLISQLVFSLGLNTVWLWMITGRGYMAILPTRVAQCVVMIPIQIVAMGIVGKKLELAKPYLLHARMGPKRVR